MIHVNYVVIGENREFDVYKPYGFRGQAWGTLGQGEVVNHLLIAMQT